MLPAVRFYTYAKRFEEAYTTVMRPLTVELKMAQPAVDILLFLANNPGMDTARDICTYRHLKPSIVSFHVDNLVQQGYLERQDIPEDRRKCRLVCTDKAAPVIRRGRAVQETFSRQLTEGLTPEELEMEIPKGGFLGLKSYLSLSPKYLPEAEIRIFDFFPKAQLKKMDELGAIVMLHIPRNGRLKDPVNLAQIMEIKQEFPNIRLIIAHIGRAYTKEDVGNAFETLDQAPDLMYDFCANCCEYAITEVLRHAGPKHVMYGTDMPILRMRTHRIEENGTYINLVPPGLYGDPKQDKHLREVSAEEAEKITFFLYEELLAFKRACKTLGLTKQDVEDIMYNNAHDLIEGARKSIYG